MARGAREVQFAYKQYRERWLMLAVVFFVNLVIQIVYITFAPIANLSSDFYGVSLSAINWLMLIWAALFLPCTAVAAWALFKYGLRNSMLAAGLVMAVGCGIRLISLVPDTRAPVGEPDEKASTSAYAALFVGTFVVASVQPIVLSTPTLLASAWFSERQRSLANTIMLLANPLGLLAGALLSSHLATEANPQRLETVLILQAVLVAAAALSTLLLRSSPPSAPSGTAAYKRPGENLGRDLKSLRANFGFFTLCNVFSLAVGGFQALLTLLDQILQPQGYTSKDAGQLSAVLVGFGIVGAAATGPLLDTTRAYKWVMAISITLAFPFFVAFILLSRQSDRKGALMICAAFVGLFGFPVLPTTLDLAAETAYPISAGLTSVILWCGSQVTTIVLVVLADGPLAVEAEEEGQPVNLEVGAWLLVGCIAAATFLSWLWSGRYVRWEAEGTVRRLQQAQRRDAGLPFVDIMAEPAVGHAGGADAVPLGGNAAAVAAAAGSEAALGLGPLGVGYAGAQAESKG